MHWWNLFVLIGIVVLSWGPFLFLDNYKERNGAFQETYKKIPYNVIQISLFLIGLVALLRALGDLLIPVLDWFVDHNIGGKLVVMLISFAICLGLMVLMEKMKVNEKLNLSIAFITFLLMCVYIIFI